MYTSAYVSEQPAIYEWLHIKDLFNLCIDLY